MTVYVIVYCKMLGKTGLIGKRMFGGEKYLYEWVSHRIFTKLKMLKMSTYLYVTLWL